MTFRAYDAHNHLQDDRFRGRQAELIEAAREMGVVRMVVNGSSCDDWPAVADLARRFPDIVIPSFGVHPWYVHEQTPDWIERLRGFLTEFPSAGVGEIGLDRWKRDLPWEGQLEAFHAQLKLAAELNRPVSIHCLRAWGALMEALESEPLPSRGILLHSYGGAPDLIPRLAARGARFSLPGYFLRPGKEQRLQTFLRVPPDRFLIETDAPDQLPPNELISHPLTDAEGVALNHPANLAAIYRCAAEALRIPLDRLVNQTESNFLALFGA